ncbi:MAG: winged helix-turn-helix transcriptional regulator [Nitrososphaerota archaeon]|nr:winged helix-turn-helix transcriptional regulator [Nitrososphaerota archaeon]
MQDNEDLRRLLWYLLGATRGGQTRARLIHALRVQPGNMNQLAKRLGVEYRTVQHHIEVLQRNSLVGSAGPRYGLTYSLTPWMAAHLAVFDDLCGRLKFKLDGGPRPAQDGLTRTREL